MRARWRQCRIQHCSGIGRVHDSGPAHQAKLSTALRLPGILAIRFPQFRQSRYGCAVLGALLILAAGCTREEAATGELEGYITALAPAVSADHPIIGPGEPRWHLSVHSLSGHDLPASVASVGWLDSNGCRLQLIPLSGDSVFSIGLLDGVPNGEVLREPLVVPSGMGQALVLGVGEGPGRVIDILPGPTFLIGDGVSGWRTVTGQYRPPIGGAALFLRLLDGGFAESWLAAARGASQFSHADTTLHLMYRYGERGEALGGLGELERAPVPEFTGLWNKGFALQLGQNTVYIRTTRADALVFDPDDSGASKRILFPVPTLPDSTGIFRPPGGEPEVSVPTLVSAAAPLGDSALIVILNTLVDRGYRQRTQGQRAIIVTESGEFMGEASFDSDVTIRMLSYGCGLLAGIAEVAGDGNRRPVLLSLQQ